MTKVRAFVKADSTTVTDREEIRQELVKFILKKSEETSEGKILLEKKIDWKTV
ncbi:hypothetical protein NPIL_545501, partial [Nephila pilipes]